MKRDPDYLRRLVLQAEADESGMFSIHRYLGMGTEQLKAVHHWELLIDMGFVAPCAPGKPNTLYRLTNAGHDFAEACRDDERWYKIRNTLQRMSWMAYSQASEQAMRTGIDRLVQMLAV